MEAPASLLQNRKYVHLWAARLVSRFGSALGFVVLVWLTYTATGSALDVAYVGLSGFLPTIAFGIFSGAIVDRLDRRRVVVLANLGRGASMGALILLLARFGFHLEFVLGASLAFSACATFFAPGSQALLPELVPKSQLAKANGLFESTESVVGVVGNGLAGILIVLVGVLPSLGADVSGYLAGAVLVALIGVSVRTGGPSPPRTSLAREVRDGFGYLRQNRGLLELTLAATVLNFLLSFVLTFLVVYSNDALHGNAVVFGLLEALLALGYGGGGLLVGRLGLARYTGRIWTYAAFGQGLAVAGMVFVPSLAFVAPLFLAFGVLQGTLNVSWLTTVQAIVPERMQGRYFAIDNTLSFAAIPASQIVGGILISVSGLSATFLLTAAGALATAGVLLTLRDLRGLGYDPRTAV